REEERRRLEEQFASEKARNETLTAQVEQQKKETAGQAPRTGGTPSASPESPSAIVALALLPGLVRGGGNVPQLTLPPTARTVSLSVNIDPRDDYPRFSVELSAQGGASVWSQNNLAARPTRSGKAIVLNLAARKFTAGRYELSLKGTTASGISEE